MASPDPFKEVLDDFKRRLTDQEKRDFQFTQVKDVKAEIERIQRTQDARREMMNLRRVESFLEAAQQFGKVIEVFTNTNNVVAFIWGPMKLILQVASSYTYAFDRILEGYEKLGESFPMLEQYKNLFGERPELKKVLQLLYKDILDFHKKALRFFTRPAWKTVFRALWMDFDATFKYLLDNLDRHGRLLHDQAQAFHMLSARENFNEIEKSLTNLESEQAAAKMRMDRDEKRRHEEEKQIVLTWIAGNIANTKDHHDAAIKERSGDPNSGLWILQHRTIEDWMNEEFPKAPLVWISGMPGAGKTVLASVVIDQCMKVPKAHAAYFYCKYDDLETLTTAGILKALLIQQLGWRSDLIPYFIEQRKTSGEPTLSSNQLAKRLFDALCKGSERQYLIVDGIDECLPDQRKDLLDCLNKAVSECDEPGNVRVLVVSQNEKDIRTKLGNAVELCVSDEQNSHSHKKDINSYVERRKDEIKDKFQLDEAACQDFNMQITDIDDHMLLIARQADGQFLYAKLVMDNLLAQGSQEEFFEEIGSSNLPKGLGEAYERIIVRLKRKDRWVDTLLLLGWMTCALRPLKWHEIQGMKSIDCGKEEVSFPRHKFRDDAIELCGSLIAINGDRVMFMHSTAKMFIAASTHIDRPVVECGLTALCLQYLSFDCFDHLDENSSHPHSDEQEQARECLKNVQRGYFAFADYAVSTWMQHLINVCNAAQTLLEEARWSERECVVQEVEEAAEVFVGKHFMSDRDNAIPVMLSENACARAARQLFTNILDDGQNVQILIRHIIRLQSTPESYKKISPPSLEKGFARIRKTIEDLASRRDISAATLSELQQFYGAKLFKCARPRCTFFHEGFTDLKTRDKHVRLHDRPHQCEVPGCTSNDFAFANPADLRKHVEEFHPDAELKARLFKIPEAGEKKVGKYLCTRCDKTFVRRNILKDHELTHTGEKPHECSFCGKGFTRKNDCVRHERIHKNRVGR